MHMRWFGVAALCAACGAATQPPPASEQPAQVVADRVSVDYAEVSPGESSSEVPVRFTNPGTSAVGALHAAVGGADPAAFAVTSDGCAQGPLPPAATCEVRVAFRPAEERAFTGVLRLDGAPAASVQLQGAGRSAARLALSQPSRSSLGAIAIGMSATAKVRVLSVGTRPAGPLTIEVTGATAAFREGGDCGQRVLAPGTGCDLEVTFTPATTGLQSYSVTVAASPFARVTAGFDGYGRRLTTLTLTKEGDGDVTSPAFSCSRWPCSVSIDVTTDTPRFTLLAAPGPTAALAGWSGDCAGAAATCEVTLDRDRAVLARFAPAVTVTIEARAIAAGAGTVSIENGASCAAPCRLSARVVRGALVRLTGAVSSDSQMRWTGDCRGANPTCALTAGGDVHAQAIFNGANYVFITSGTWATDLGISGYDTACQRSAAGAGLPGRYVAWMSTSRTPAAARLAGARGFVRVDGKPFADVLDGRAPVFYPPMLDEFGQMRGTYPGYAMTGTGFEGETSAGYNCADWSEVGAFGLRLGDPTTGAGAWSGWGWSSCQIGWPIYCLGTDLRRPLQFVKPVGRLAFLSSQAFLGGGGLAAADAVCRTDASAAGLRGAFKALLAVEGASAASRFDLGGLPWVRPDGVAIVEKARDLADGALLAPIDVSAAGAYDFWFSATWGGARTPGQPGTAASTCSSWTSRTPGTTFPMGSPPTTSLDFWFGNGAGPCEHAYRVYCLQE